MQENLSRKIGRKVRRTTCLRTPGLVFLQCVSSFRKVITPDLLGDVNLEANLGPLLLLGKLVALSSGRETALVAQAQLVKATGALGSGFVQTLDDLVLVVKSVLLGGHETKNDNLVLGKVAERSKVTGTGVIVLEEVSVDVEVLEENLGHRLVTTRGEPLRLVVAPAEMDTDLHVGRLLGDSCVDELGILLGQSLQVFVPGLGLLAHLGVAEIGEVGVVELDKAAAGLIEQVKFLLVDAGQVLKEEVQIRVRVDVDASTATPEVDHGGRGDGDLGGGTNLLVLGDGILQKVEIVDLDGLCVLELAGDAQDGRGTILDLAGDGDAIELLEEVEVEVGAAELAISDGAQAVLHLLGHDLLNPLVLDLAQLFGGDGALGLLLAGVEHRLGPEPRTNVVGPVDTSRKTHFANSENLKVDCRGSRVNLAMFKTSCGDGPHRREQRRQLQCWKYRACPAKPPAPGIGSRPSRAPACALLNGSCSAHIGPIAVPRLLHRQLRLFKLALLQPVCPPTVNMRADAAFPAPRGLAARLPR